MAKKPEPKSPPTNAEKTAKKTNSATLSRQLRDLTTLELKIVKLLQEHATNVVELAQSCPKDIERRLTQLTALQSFRKSNDQGANFPIAKMCRKSPGPLQPVELGNIFRELVSAERVLLSPERVAYLGPAHSYSHLATLARFGSSIEFVPVGTISTVFEEVADGQAQWGVVPIENSTDGRIVDTLEMFTKSSVKICGEIPLPIHHNLLGKGARDQIAEVCSKPQAISQCRQWLAKHMPGAKLSPVSSTTAAAKKAAKNEKVAAIASQQAGVQYGLKVLAKNIEDNQDNVTRFAVIGSQPAAKTGNDKTSLMFELKHEPGALASAMSIFKSKRLNLTWIESFPKPGSPSEYLFFVEFLGHQVEARVKRALEQLKKRSVRLEVLGSYPVVT